MNNQRPVSRVKTRSAEDQNQRASRQWLYLMVAGAALLIILLNVNSAKAQFPRLGLSASPDHYEGFIDVALDEEFELYICVFGEDEDTPLDQGFSTISWVLHQVCCGAALVVSSVEYNPSFQHEGLPSLGVVSSSEGCVDEPSILLATLTATMFADEDGEYLVASGPYGQPVDCEGNNPVVMGMAMTIGLTGVSIPTETDTWESVKSYYR